MSPEWLVNTLSRATDIGSVKNNTSPETIARRDQATREWKDALAAYKKARSSKSRKVRAAATPPDPRAKPEYSVVWSSKQNVADVHADVISKLITNATVNPQGLADLLNPQFLPGLDGWQVIDNRKLNVDGSENEDYGKVVNFVQLPLPWGVENEAHHMQYQWEDGDPIVAGSLYLGTTFVLDPKDVPNLRLTNIIDPLQNPGGSIADAYEKGEDGRFTLTLMGGPLANFGGSPGQLITFKPDPVKGLVKESEVAAGNVLGTSQGNAGGIKEPCTVREARPLGTCANPHGIQFRPDIGVGITSDYAEPREIVLDPVKTIDKYAFRPTVRSWDLSDKSRPKLRGVAKVPNGPLKPAQRAHEQYGIMENAKTWPKAEKRFGRGGIDSNAFFAGSMCGGGVFLIPDAREAKGDFSDKIVQVWNDGISVLNANDKGNGKFADEPGGCAGGAWHQVSPNNRYFFRAVQGRNAGGDNYFDQGEAKLVYSLDVSPTIESAKDGKVTCDLSRGFEVDGKKITGIKAFQRLAKGETLADCPRLASTLQVNDITSGGPHWGALDNHSLDQNGTPWRLTFSNYFVSRTGVDGDHRFYTVDVSPDGKLSYDEDFRDENTGAIGVNFNRRDWPGSKDAGFYKPHSMLWVCPPGVCPKDAAPAVREDPASLKAAAKKKAAKKKKARKKKASSRKAGSKSKPKARSTR